MTTPAKYDLNNKMTSCAVYICKVAMPASPAPASLPESCFLELNFKVDSSGGAGKETIRLTSVTQMKWDYSSKQSPLTGAEFGLQVLSSSLNPAPQGLSIYSTRIEDGRDSDDSGVYTTLKSEVQAFIKKESSSSVIEVTDQRSGVKTSFTLEVPTGRCPNHD